MFEEVGELGGGELIFHLTQLLALRHFTVVSGEWVGWGRWEEMGGDGETRPLRESNPKQRGVKKFCYSSSSHPHPP